MIKFLFVIDRNGFNFRLLIGRSSSLTGKHSVGKEAGYHKREYSYQKNRKRTISYKIQYSEKRNYKSSGKYING